MKLKVSMLVSLQRGDERRHTLTMSFNYLHPKNMLHYLQYLQLVTNHESKTKY